MNGRLDRLATVIRLGTWSAVAVVGVGTAWLAVAPPPPRPAGDLLGQLAAGGPGSVVMAGLLLLALTPVSVVAAAAVSFVRLGERRYAVAASTALALLVAGLLAGILTGLDGG